MSDAKDNQSGLVRLSKLMAERGICSRREADVYIEKGQVFVDGLQIKELGTKVSPDSRIELGAKALKSQKDLVTVILNKPIGYVSAQPEDNYKPAIQLLTLDNYFGPELNSEKQNIEPKRLNNLAVAGRLDIDSQGLLVFTQDGRIAKQLIGEDSNIEKEYLVRFRGDVNKEVLTKLSNGSLVLDGKKLKRAVAEQINPDQLRIILTEGKKRQIRRMCELVGLQVVGLKRVRIGSLVLGKLPEGKWRFLERGEHF
jgi:23S rRNA pseudouridine2604 synthase